MIGSATFEDALNSGNTQHKDAMANGYDMSSLFIDDKFIKLVDVAACRSKGINPLM